MTAQLTLIRGLPGSGKSTLAKVLAEKYNGKHFEADMFFVDDAGNYNWTADKIGLAHAWCQGNVKAYLEWNYPVFVSNTFTTEKELRPYFDIALEFGITPVIITMQNDFGNVHAVPQEAIDRMKNRFVYDLTDMFAQHEKNLVDKYWRE